MITMKNLLSMLVIMAVITTFSEAKFADRKIFVSKLSGVHKTLSDLETIRKNVRKGALSNLFALPQDIKAELQKHAEQIFQKSHYPIKTATEYMEYFRSGNRVHYERKLTQHRERIVVLTVGHLLDQQLNSTSTKFLDEIANGLWSLCEESTWSLPAHLYLQKTDDHNLPTPGGRPAIDLVAGEDAKLLAWIKLLLGEAIDRSVSPVINKRIDFELRKRIFEPFLEIDDFFWEGFNGKGHVVNNWNIWVNGNILKAAVFTLNSTTHRDDILFNKVLNKTLYSADYFLDGYGEDGGCDEGPAYWRQAGGRLIEYLGSLDQLFPMIAKTYFSGIPLLKRIGEYAYKMRITGNWFVNFADAIPKISYPPSLLFQYGLLFNDKSMKEFASYMNTLKGGAFKSGNNNTDFAHALLKDLSDVNEFFNFLTFHGAIDQEAPLAPDLPLVWLPDIQVVTARVNIDEINNRLLNSFFMAAKAGSNHESHNHNDVGSFVLFAGPHPILIDVGVGTYTAATFGAHRYDLFYMQSAWHNGCPTINGVQQMHGGSYEAHNTSLVSDGSSNSKSPNEVVFTTDMAGAYPKNASVSSWKRTLTFSQNSSRLVLEDQFHLKTFTHPQQLHFMTVEGMKVEKTSTGLLLSGVDKVIKTEHFKVAMDFDWTVFGDWREELKSLEGDHHLTQVWGNNVKRITLQTATGFKKTEASFKVVFREVN